MATATSYVNKPSITEVKFKILGSFRTLLLKYSIFFLTLKDEVSIYKQCSYFHAKNERVFFIYMDFFYQICLPSPKLIRKLNFPNIFRLATLIRPLRYSTYNREYFQYTLNFNKTYKIK